MNTLHTMSLSVEKDSTPPSLHTWTRSFVKHSEVWEAMTSALSPVRLEQVDKEPLLVYAGK